MIIWDPLGHLRLGPFGFNFDYKMGISVYPPLLGLQDEDELGESVGRVLGESVGTVLGECCESVGRVLGECGESVVRV